MTVPARLENLEAGQVKILSEIGDLKGQVGRLDGTLSQFLEAWDRECTEKHAAIETRFEVHEKRLDSHEHRLATLERRAAYRIANWSLTRKTLAFTAGLAAFVGVIVGIVEALSR